MWRLQFLEYLRILHLKFQKDRTKIEVVLSLPCWLSQFSWDSQQGRVRTTSILVQAFWNFKLKVLKYSRSCSLHNTLIPWSLKNPESPNIHIWTTFYHGVCGEIHLYVFYSFVMCSADVRGPKQCWCLWQEPFFQLTYPIFCLLPSWLVNPRGYFYHHPFGSSRDRVSVKVLIKIPAMGCFYGLQSEI